LRITRRRSLCIAGRRNNLVENIAVDSTADGEVGGDRSEAERFGFFTCRKQWIGRYETELVSLCTADALQTYEDLHPWTTQPQGERPIKFEERKWRLRSRSSLSVLATSVALQRAKESAGLSSRDLFLSIAPEPAQSIPANPQIPVRRAFAGRMALTSVDTEQRNFPKQIFPNTRFSPPSIPRSTGIAREFSRRGLLQNS
jgi:hypothetical protein